MFSINGTKNAWIFGRDAFALEYAKAEEQIRALTSEAESEGYKVIGTTTIRESINSKQTKNLCLQSIGIRNGKNRYRNRCQFRNCERRLIC